MNPLAIKPLFAFGSLAETAEAIAALGGSRPEGARIGVLRQGGRWCVYLWGVSAGTVALDKRNPAALAGLLECGSFAEAAEYAAAHEAGKAKLLMPSKAKKNGRGYPSQPYLQIPALVQAILQKRGGLAGCKNSELLLFFTIINAARGSAARLLEWPDVDLEEKVWVLRANKEKSKVKTDSYYPITPIQMQILEEMKKRRIDETQAVFPSHGPNKNGEFYLSDNTLNKILKDHKVESDVEGRFAVVHGYRSSFSNYAAENRKYQINDDGEIVVFDRDLSEKQLQHKIKNKVRGAYERTPEIEARRALVTEWEQLIFCKATSW